MTDSEHIPPAETDTEVLGMARLLAAHPNAQRGLQRSIERQQEAREKNLSQRAAPMDCPYCGAPGVVYLQLAAPGGLREYRHKPMDCCQPALRDAAENALHYALNPNNDAEERVDAADRYAAIKASLTEPALLRELETHELVLADIESRVSGLTRAQGGVDA